MQQLCHDRAECHIVTPIRERSEQTIFRSCSWFSSTNDVSFSHSRPLCHCQLCETRYGRFFSSAGSDKRTDIVLMQKTNRNRYSVHWVRAKALFVGYGQKPHVQGDLGRGIVQIWTIDKEMSSWSDVWCKITIVRRSSLTGGCNIIFVLGI